MSLKQTEKSLKHARNLIVILLVIVIGLAFAIPELRILMLLYGALLGLSLSLYQNKLRDKQLIKTKYVGFGGGTFIAIIIGIGIGATFIILNKTNSALALAAPIISLSIVDDVRNFIKVGLAPFIEEISFNGSWFGFLRDSLGLGLHSANQIKSITFALYHTYAYGVVAGLLENLSELIGAFQATLGTFIAAYAFSIAVGYALNKWRNMYLSSVAHIIINYALAIGLVIGGVIIAF